MDWFRAGRYVLRSADERFDIEKVNLAEDHEPPIWIYELRTRKGELIANHHDYETLMRKAEGRKP